MTGLMESVLLLLAAVGLSACANHDQDHQSGTKIDQSCWSYYAAEFNAAKSADEKEPVLHAIYRCTREGLAADENLRSNPDYDLYQMALSYAESLDVQVVRGQLSIEESKLKVAEIKSRLLQIKSQREFTLGASGGYSSSYPDMPFIIPPVEQQHQPTMVEQMRANTQRSPSTTCFIIGNMLTCS